MLSRNEHVFEVGYERTGAVVDHSELYLTDVPGGSEFGALMEIRRAGGQARGARAVGEQADLAPRIRQWLSLPEAVEAFDYDGERFQFTWRSPAKGTGVLFLRRQDKLSLGVLLLAGLDAAEGPASPDPEAVAEEVFTGMLRDRLSDPTFERAEALKQVRLTRRPLVATVFWPPRGEDSGVRIIQRVLAFQFFAEHGVIRSNPTTI